MEQESHSLIAKIVQLSIPGGILGLPLYLTLTRIVMSPIFLIVYLYGNKMGIEYFNANWSVIKKYLD